MHFQPWHSYFEHYNHFNSSITHYDTIDTELITIWHLAGKFCKTASSSTSNHPYPIIMAFSWDGIQSHPHSGAIMGYTHSLTLLGLQDMQKHFKLPGNPFILIFIQLCKVIHTYGVLWNSPLGTYPFHTVLTNPSGVVS